MQLSILYLSPFDTWVNNVDKVRKESKIVLDHFLAKGQAPGTGNAPFWKRRVAVDRLSKSKDILREFGFRKSKASTQVPLHSSPLPFSFGSYLSLISYYGNITYRQCSATPAMDPAII